MKKITLSDFSGGMIQRVAPDDYAAGEWGALLGFVPDGDKSIRSQWPIQSIGGTTDESAEGETWENNSLYNATRHNVVKAIYPLQSTVGIFLVAIMENGAIWWAKAPASGAAFGTANGVQWNPITQATNRGLDITKTAINQPTIDIEDNPDYRFICDMPFEIYKYIKRAVDTSNGTPSGYVAVYDFDKDTLPDTLGNTDDAGASEDSFVVLAKQLTSNVATITTTLTHTILPGQSIVVSGLGTTFDGTHVVTAVTSTTILYAKTAANVAYTVDAGLVTLVTVAPRSIVPGVLIHSRRYYFEGKLIRTNEYDDATNTLTRTRTQTAVVAYVDPYGANGAGVVRAVTFPNVRRWPLTAVSGTGSGYATKYQPMLPRYVMSNKSIGDAKYIAEYPFAATGSILNPAVGGTNAYPKPENTFHPYTYYDAKKVLKPGIGFIPRGFVGTMWNGQLIIGDIEYRSDATGTPDDNGKLPKVASRAFMPNSQAPFGLRDGNTEPHRGFAYFSEQDIDIFDPISILPVAGTETRIAGMHALNNKLVCVTTQGSNTDGVISFTGNLSQLHPYTPGVIGNPNAIRRELVHGGIGTADSPDHNNHGNPQTCLWPEMGRVAFIDKSGYTYVTDGGTASLLDDRFPIRGVPNEATVDDHVAAVGRHLFMYKNGFLYVYTVNNKKGAWSVLRRPNPYWGTGEGVYYSQYNVIRSMRGIGNELYFVVHTYRQNYTDAWITPNGAPFIATSKVMRYALNGPDNERGRQDGQYVDGLEIQTPALGFSDQNTKTNWSKLAVDFYTETGCILNGAGTVANLPLGGVTSTVEYHKGYFTVDLPNLDSSNEPVFGTQIEDYPTTGFHHYEMLAGIGPQNVMSARLSFRGDVKIEGVSIFYTGAYELSGE